MLLPRMYRMYFDILPSLPKSITRIAKGVSCNPSPVVKSAITASNMLVNCLVLAYV